MAAWQVQQAKSRFSELIEDAQTKGPQIITKHGAETAVVLSINEYRSLTSVEPRMDLAEFLLRSPKFLTDEEHDEMFGNLRDPNDTGRNIDYLFEDDDA